MPRYRKLHTKIVESLDFDAMPDDFTRLTWVLLPLALCREGRGLNCAEWVKAKLFPVRKNVTARKVRAALDWFIERGMVITYSVEGRDYFYVPSFRKYQGGTEKEAESDYPAPPDLLQTNSRVTPELLQTNSGVTPELLQTNSSSDTTTDATTDADADTTTTTNADAVAAALAGFGMGEAEKVAQEAAGYYVEEVEDLIAHATAHKLGPGWLREELRHGRRAPPAVDEHAQAVKKLKAIPGVMT